LWRRAAELKMLCIGLNRYAVFGSATIDRIT
jgi:hypothetical protein